MRGRQDSIDVLHVDDDAAIVEIAAEILERENERFSVESAGDVSEGLDRLHDGDFDCVVSDYDMPGRNGIEFLERVRADYPDLPFIFFTGKGSEEVASDAITAGVTDYLQKGTGTERYTILANRISNYVEGARVERERDRMRERMDLVLEHTDSVVYEIDLDTDEVRRLGNFQGFFDVSPEDVPTWKSHLDTAVHPEDREQFRRFHRELVGGDRDGGTLEYRTNPETGEVRWIRDEIHVADEDAGVALGLAQDVTTRKERERNREQVIERVTDAIVEVDAEWQFTLVNEQAEALYDTPAEALLGKEFWTVFDGALDTRFEEVYRRVMETREPGSLVEYYAGLDGWFDVQVYPNDDGGLAFYFQEITEEREREQRLKAIFNNTYTFVGLLEPDGTILEANETALSFGGMEREDVVGELLWETGWVEPFPDSRATVRDAIQAARTGSISQHEIRIRGSDGDIVIDFSVRPVTSAADEVTLLVVEGRDVTERQEREQMLTLLHERTRHMARADDVDSIERIAIDTLSELLEADGTAFLGLREDNELEFHYRRGAFEAIETTRFDEGVFWDTLVSEDERVWRDDDRLSGADIRTAFVVPVSNHGVVAMGWNDDYDISKSDRTVAHLVAENLAAALDRYRKEADIRKRDRELQRRNETLEQLDRLNRIIRRINRTLIRSPTSGSVGEEVCEQFAEADGYTCAWIGAPSPDDGGVDPHRWAGMDTEFVEQIRTADSHHPLRDLVRAASAEETVQVVRDLLGDPDWERHRRAALEYGYRSIAAVPIVQDDHVDRVLVLHATASDAYDERERSVLAELGETIGHTLGYMQRVDVLRRDERIEVEVEIGGDRLFLNRVTAELEGPLSVVGSIPHDDGSLRVFLRQEKPSGRPVETLSEFESVVDVQQLSGEDGLLLQVTSAPTPFVRKCQEVDVRLQSISVDSRATTAVLAIPGDLEVRSVIEALETVYPETTLLARREATAPDETGAFLDDHLLDRLTERQREALQAAHYGGFYEWPRQTTNEELADALDTSSSTYQYHLRAAERTIVDALLE